MKWNDRILAYATIAICIICVSYFLILKPNQAGFSEDQTRDLLKVDVEYQVNLLSSNLFDLFPLNGFVIPGIVQLTDQENRITSLEKILDTGRKFVLYYSELSCEQCIDFSNDLLDELHPSWKNHTLIIISTLKTENLGSFLRSSKSDIPVFFAPQLVNILDGQINESKPIFFILDKDGKVLAPFYPERALPELSKQYVRTIWNR